MMRRSLVATAVVLMMLGGACAQNGDDVRGDVAQEEEDDQRPTGRGAEDFADGPKTEVVWQNTVADIEPVSRYTEDASGPDVAHITTVLALAEEAGQDLRDFLEGLDDVDSKFSEDGRIVTMKYDQEVPEDPETADRYTFTIEAPVEFARLQEDGDVAVTALLPRPAQGYQDGPTYDVELVSTDGESDNENFESQEESQRDAIFWYKRGDPPWQTVYDLIDGP